MQTRLSPRRNPSQPVPGQLPRDRAASRNRAASHRQRARRNRAASQAAGAGKVHAASRSGAAGKDGTADSVPGQLGQNR